MRKSIAAIAATAAIALTGAAMPAAAATLYAIDNGNSTLVTLDSTTGAKSTVGALGTSVAFGDLAWDGTTLFMLGGRSNDALYSVNTTTGAATLIGSHGINDLFGLAYNPLNGTLYASQFSGGDGVYAIDKTTGVATLLSTGYPGIGGMTFNSTLGQLVGTEDGTGYFFTINAVTGAETLISTGSGFVDDSDLVHDAGSNSYFLADYSGNFYRYDATTYTRTLIAGGLGNMDGLALLGDVGGPGPVPEPATWALLILGFGAIGAGMRRRQTCAGLSLA